jgi:hypothetical protein
MPRVAQGKKLFNSSLPIELLEELEYVSDVLGKPKTKIIEMAIAAILVSIKKRPEWEEQEKRFHKLKERRQERIKDIKQIFKVGYKPGAGKDT